MGNLSGEFREENRKDKVTSPRMLDSQGYQ